MNLRFSFIPTFALVFLLSCPLHGEEGQTVTGPIFENSLGQKFVEVDGTTTLFCIWETRNRDFEKFVRASGRKWNRSGFSQGSNYPAARVNWEDASFFCAWLTEKERKTGILPQEFRYRLPTSAEWSLAVGLKPADPDSFKVEAVDTSFHFPWAGAWPPPKNSGNYHPELGIDRYTNTSPVGSFAPNQFGIYDLGGNLWEWCKDSYKNSIDFRVLRGASWRMRSAGDLLSSLEIGNVSSIRLSTYGFRVVIDRSGAY